MTLNDLKWPGSIQNWRKLGVICIFIAFLFYISINLMVFIIIYR